MPLSKANKRKYMKDRRQAQKRATGASLLSKADVRAMRKAGLRVEDLEGEQGANVSFQAFSALMRDRDAIKAHMAWHHESMKNPDVATILERASSERIATLEALLATQSAMVDTEVMQRLTKVEVDQALHEAEHEMEVRDARLHGELADRKGSESEPR